jgi:GTP cyclohydrolase I
MDKRNFTLSFTDDLIVEKLTPSRARIERAFAELFGGYKLRAEEVLNEVAHVSNYSGLVTMRDINFYSYCEHHFAPFFGKVSVTYEPGTVITGLGKLVRLVRDVHARRLQIQELMVRDIAEDIFRILGAKGVFIESTAKHLCICSRGPSDDSVQTYVSYGCGSLTNHRT